MIGCTLILIVAPVAADLSQCVEEASTADDDQVKPGGAYAQAYALFNCAMAAATMFGAVFAGWLRQQFCWATMCTCLGIFAFSGTIPSVRMFLSQADVVTNAEKRLQLFYTGGWIFDKHADNGDEGESNKRKNLIE